MPKKPGDRVPPASLANLKPGIAKKEGRERLSAYVLPSTKASLNASGLAVGESIDIAEFIRRNMLDLQTGKAQLGLIRLVNPWRGQIWCADIQTKHGTLSARTGSKPKQAFEQWDVYHCVGDSEFYCGRSFSKRELMRWFSASVPDADDQPQEDELGSIPANTPDPKAWKWFALTQGETVLKPEYKPTAADFQKVAGYALAVRPDEFYPYLDQYEIWVCDKETLEPIALVMTANSLEQADRMTFSPMVKFDRNLKGNNPALRELEDRINQRVNSSEKSNTFKWVHRLYKRNLDGTAIEYARENPNDTSLPLMAMGEAVLPEPYLAEPYWSEYLSLGGLN
jgi:hypothetical protein